MKRRRFLQSAAGLAAWSVAGRAAASDGGVVRGRVTGAGKPLAGVRVSDGCRVVRTDAEGAYELALGPDSAGFVFVSCPPGYWTERFYHAIAGLTEPQRLDFPLTAVDQPPDFDIAVIADVHIEKREHAIPRFQATIAEINALAPALVWDLGDMSVYPDAGPVYTDCTRALAMPLRACPGNHDVGLYDADPRALFSGFFGPTYYSFDWGGVHCVTLDGNTVVEREGKNTVDACINGSQLRWLEADLAATPPETPVLCAIHIPIVSTYIERRGGGSFPETFPIAPQFSAARAAVLLEILRAHNVPLVVQGHAHENERATVKGIEFVSTISVCGSWWRAKEGIERGVDNVPRGYRVIEVRGGRIRHRYVSSAESKTTHQGEFEGLEAKVPRAAATPFLFNGYDAPNHAAAVFQIDGGTWQPMAAFTGKGGYVTMQMPHHFEAVTDTTGLATGPHTITARVTWPDAGPVEESAAFAVV